MKRVLEMTAEELNETWREIMRDADKCAVSKEQILDSQGNFKKFSLYEDFDIEYSMNATAR